MSEQRPTTKVELMESIDRHWKALNDALNRLSDKQLTEIKDAQGWSVKDHVIHMMAWERSVVFFLDHKPRHEGLGVGEGVYKTGDDDAINAVIYDQRKATPLAEVLAQFRDVHQQLMNQLKPMSDADLQRRYKFFLPEEVGEGEGPTAFNVIYGNTANHFAEHQGWIETLVKTG